MSLRRPILILALGSLVVAGFGLRDWPVDGARATTFADRAFETYGLSVRVEGAASLTLLPLPRLTLNRVRVATASGGPALAEDGRLVLDLDPLSLLAGRAAVGGLRLDGARLSADADWRAPVSRLAEQARAGATVRPRRLTVSGARLAGGDEARDIDLDLAWPFWSASAEGSASLTWRGVPTRITLANLRPAELVQGRRSPFTAEVTWAGGNLAAEGTVAAPGAGTALPVLAGKVRAETRSLPECLAWIGRDVPLSPLAGAFSIAGRFETTDRAVSWPSLRIGLGRNVLEGAGAVALGPGDAPRLSVQATLAAESLDLAPLVGDLRQVLDREPRPLALGPFTRGDLDLRLSAAEGRAGPVQVQDLAASVLVRNSAIEVAVNRARIQNGTFKGRVILASGSDPAATEMRAQGSLDRLDLGSLLNDIGAARWLTGPAHGQFALEASARDSAALLARLGGRASLVVEGGTITGLDLADVIHRNGAVAPGALARRNGRTAFERAAITLRFVDGIGEIAEAGLIGPSVGASLHGQVSLPERRVRARGSLALRPSSDPLRGLVFEIAGPLSAPTAQTVARGEAAEPAERAGEALLTDAFKEPAALGIPGMARAYAP
ncbi:AsmA family protein [Methylobacterium mesophilicum SR1.6/6]|uniref:AsmA family protein n=1 Tax=Methylobacterium mesophilicum SR1.6/6 TaxID=908290 RepID=A0A6B9FIV8_9HYPH|nr:AsmA-like C-terminal region-containing protein [Methylobacterium mesophilicum]QGY01115.1 AsmA family protein [Methylobacterium mesophilicum SR1.6/6]